MTEKTEVPVTAEAEKPSGTPATAGRTALGSLRNEIDRLFDSFEPFEWLGRRPHGLPPMMRGSLELSPAVDFSENEAGYEMTAELPGMDEKDIEVKLANRMLTIRGEKSEEKTEERKDYHLSERRWGSFQRSVRLPDDVDRDRIEAHFAKGVLTVRLPKSAEAKAAEKVIEIAAG